MVLLPEFLQSQVVACVQAVLSMQLELDVQIELNFVIPSLISDHELDYIFPYITESITTTCEKHDANLRAQVIIAEEEEAKAGSTSPNSLPFFPHRLSGENLVVNVGVSISTPRAALRAGAIAAVQGVQFLSFDLLKLTSSVFDFTETEATNFMEAFISKHILAGNPFKKLDVNGVGSLIKQAITSARSAKPGLVFMSVGPQNEDAKSMTFLQNAGINVISISPNAIPVTKIASAQATIAQEKEDASNSVWNFSETLQALDKSLFEDPFMMVVP
jgi:hypothetical protein